MHFNAMTEQALKYPSTRFMGSKSKLINDIWTIASQFQFDTAIDLFSGSGVVGYMFKAQGKTVVSNDYMSMSATFAKALIENNKVTLAKSGAKKLLVPNFKSDGFVEKTFKDLYFIDTDNQLIDTLIANIEEMKNPYKRAIALSALIRACIKKRPRGIFTYTGHRYDDGRRDIKLSLQEQFLEAIGVINNAIFDNGKRNSSLTGDALVVKPIENSLIYIDPPYYSPFSDNEYVRRYHFVEGIARNWEGVEIQEHTKTKKFKSYPTPFSTRKGASEAFEKLFERFKNSTMIVSYSSNSLPNKEEMISLISNQGKCVDIVPIDYKYSFGTHGHKVGDNKNNVKEYLFVGH